jgi:hypothetical protein
MSEPKTDGVRRIFREMKIGEQPAQKRTKDISMDQTTTTSEAGINVKDHEVRYSTRNCGGVGLTINWASTGRIAIS